MPSYIHKQPHDAVEPPQGFIFLARRLNRHRYHLVPRHAVVAGRADEHTLCGERDESSEHTMPYLLAYDADKRCAECLRLASQRT